MPALAHNPHLEPTGPQQHAPADISLAHRVGDPGLASEAIYGRLGEPGEVDIYEFIPAESASLPFEILVPVRAPLAGFRPTLALIARGLPVTSSEDLPVRLPDGFGIRLITDPGTEPRPEFFEPFSMERYWRGGRETVEIPARASAYIAVFDATGRTGDYVIGTGTVENFSAMTFPEVVRAIVRLKLGFFGGFQPPWVDITGILLTVIGFALAFGRTLSGLLVIARGTLAIDEEGGSWEGKSIANWLFTGLLLMALGSSLLYRVNGIAGVAIFQILLAVPLFGLWYFLRRKGRGRRGLVIGIFLTAILLLATMSLFAWHIAVLA